MQETYIRDNGSWHVINNAYVREQGQWHLVQNSYIFENGSWHLAFSNDGLTGLTQTYNLPGEYTYVVPEGVFNLELSYQTTSGVATLQVPSVNPGEKIPVKIGDYGQVSTFGTREIPAYDHTVFQFVGYVNDYFKVKFAAAVENGASYVGTGTQIDQYGISNVTNDQHSVAASVQGCVYDIMKELGDGSLVSTIYLSPVPLDTLTNVNNTRVAFQYWNGKDGDYVLTPIEFQRIPGNDRYVSTILQPNIQSSSNTYTWAINVQQILEVAVTPAPPPQIVIDVPDINQTVPIGNPAQLQFEFSVSGGQPPYLWTASPTPNLLLQTDDSLGCSITYAPLSTGTFTYSVTVKDSNNIRVTTSTYFNVIE